MVWRDHRCRRARDRIKPEGQQPERSPSPLTEQFGQPENTGPRQQRGPVRSIAPGVYASPPRISRTGRNAAVRAPSRRIPGVGQWNKGKRGCPVYRHPPGLLRFGRAVQWDGWAQLDEQQKLDNSGAIRRMVWRDHRCWRARDQIVPER